MLKYLLAVRLRSLLGSMSGKMSASGKRGKGTTALMVLLMVYVFGFFSVQMGVLFSQLVGPMIEMGIEELYFGTAGIMALSLCIIGSAFVAQSQMFDAKDNELLLSMPIPPSMILLSRILVLFVLNLCYGVIVIAPSMIVYLAAAPASAGQVLCILLSFLLLLPLLATTASCLIGGLIALLTMRLRSKNMISMLFSLLFLFGYMALYLNLQNIVASMIVNGTAFLDAIRSVLPPIYALGMACMGDGLHLLYFVLWCAAPFAAVYLLLSRFFLRITTTKLGGRKIRYREKEMKVRTPRTAFLCKELRRFFTLPVYMINAGLGALLAVLLAVGASIFAGDLNAILAEFPDGFRDSLLTVALCFCAATTMTSSVSLSLEGRSLWIIKSSPVRAGDIFLAKVAANVVIGGIPLLLSGAVLWIAFGMSFARGLLVMLLPQLTLAFFALLGMLINIAVPRFDWVNEVVVIKQSMASFLTVMTGMTMVVLPMVIYFTLLFGRFPPDLFLLLWGAAMLIASAPMVVYLERGAGKRLEKMS